MSEVYFVGVVVERTSTTTAIVKIRADSQSEADQNAQTILQEAFRGQRAEQPEIQQGVEDIMDWSEEGCYCTFGLDTSEDWSKGYDPDVDLTGEMTDAERLLDKKQLRLI